MAMRTPWGSAQTEEQLAPGITQVSTAGHGGIHVAATLNRQIHKVWRQAGGWYEEDCDWALVALTFPQHFSEKHVTYAHDSAKRWHAKSYAVAMGVDTTETVSVGDCPSCGRRVQWHAGRKSVDCSVSGPGCEAAVPLRDELRIHHPDGSTTVGSPASTTEPAAPTGLEVKVGAMFTVTAHALPHGPRCGGGWHARILAVPRDGAVDVQQMKVDGGRWRPSMQTMVFVHALQPLAVPVDADGNPVGADAAEQAEDVVPIDMEAIAAAVNEALAAAVDPEPAAAWPPPVGEKVLHWEYDDPMEYGGLGEHGGEQLVIGRRTQVRCSPDRMAPADAPQPDAKDPRIKVTKGRKPAAWYSGDWCLELPDQPATWHKTKREATADGVRRLAILDWHAGQMTAVN